MLNINESIARQYYIKSSGGENGGMNFLSINTRLYECHAGNPNYNLGYQFKKQFADIH